MTPEETFSKNLAYLCDEHCIDPGDLASEIGTTRQNARNWINGRCVCGFTFLVRISDLFDVGIDNLLTIDLSKQ